MTYIGLPIEGEIAKADRRVEQWPDELLEEAFVKAFELPELIAVRWRQYTPYFNDGDPCVFHAYGVGFRLADTDEEAGDYEDGYDEPYSIKGLEYSYVGMGLDRQREVKNPHMATRAAAIWGLEKAVEGGHHYDRLLELFGDHAIVTATRDKFAIEFYDHD